MHAPSLVPMPIMWAIAPLCLAVSVADARAADATHTLGQQWTFVAGAGEDFLLHCGSPAGCGAAPQPRDGEGAQPALLQLAASSRTEGTSHVACVLVALIIAALLPVLHYQGVLPFLAVVSYIGCICMVKICVKDLFMNGYEYPYTITMLHMLFTSIFASMIDCPSLSEGRPTFRLSVMKAASLGMNNMALVFGSAAFVSIIGSCTPATTYFVELVRVRSPTAGQTIGVTFVCLGAMLCVHGDPSFSALSLILAVGACFSRSLKSVWSYDLLQVNMSAYRLAAWSSIWSCIFMFVPALIIEGLVPYRMFLSMSLHNQMVLVASCLIATWLNIVMCFCLKYLGPVQQNVFGQLELLAVLMLATVLLNEVVTVTEWMGVLLILSGCLFTKLDDQIKRLTNVFFGTPESKAETQKLMP